MPRQAKLRKREIVFAVSMGALAAGAGALILDQAHDSPTPVVASASQLTYQLAPFTAISTVGPEDVIITRGDTQAVSAEGSPDALSHLDIVVDDGTLTIRPNMKFGSFNWRRFGSVMIRVTVPRLEAVSLAGSGDVRVDRVAGPFFAGSVVGPGNLAIDNLQVDKADFSLAGTGNLKANGTAGEARLSIAGTGDIDAVKLHSRKAAVSIGGSGDAALTVDGDARVSIMGSGDVTITGAAHCSVSRMGSGKVACGNSGEE